MPPKRYSELSPEEKAARRRQFNEGREERMRARMNGRTKEQYQQDRKKEMEERKKKREEELRERTKDWTKDEDFKECVKQFMTSHSIRLFLLNSPMPGLGHMFPDVRNDQQKVLKVTAADAFATEFQYGEPTRVHDPKTNRLYEWRVLIGNQKKAFYHFLDKYPNNFFDTQEEFDEHVKKWEEKMKSRLQREKFEREYNKFKKMTTNPNTLKYEPRFEPEIQDAIGYEPKKNWEERIHNVNKRAKALRAQMKEKKRQEVKQYPPRYTTSKPTPPKPMTSTYKPKLNLSHIQQVNQPATVPPSENTRKPSLSVSSVRSKHIPEQISHEREKGQIQGIEEDGRIYNSEKAMYISALEKLGRYTNLPQPRYRIKATNDVLTEVEGLPGRKRFTRRLTGWV